MSITALSFAGRQVPLPPAAAEAPRPSRRNEVEPADRPRGRDGGAGRLEQALTAALQTLGVGPSATPPAVAEADPAVADSAEPTTLTSAVHEFAEALYAALREVGGGRGQGHGHGHHGDHGWRGRGYGSLSNRLENLAATLGSVAPAAPAATAPDSATIEAAAAGAATEPATAPPVTQPVALPSPQTSPQPSPQPSALLAAFTRLQAALQPASEGTAADPAAALKQFLQTLAQGLKGALPEGETTRSGSLVNLSA